MPEATVSTPVVEATGVYKRFGSTQALRGIALALAPGRCLGLVGRNGAGKSTLVSILSGSYPPGQLGLARAGLVSWRGMRDAAQQLMAEWGYPIDVRLPCGALTVEQRQIVEIARALAAGTRCSTSPTTSKRSSRSARRSR